MKTIPSRRFFRFSIIMPFLGFFLSLGLLFPYRQSLAEEVRAAFSPRPAVQYSLPPNLDIDAVIRVASISNFDPDPREKRYIQVAALNLPALLATLPIEIFSKSHDSWSPGGMDYLAWQAINFTVIGTIFWWLIGRGFDAILRPRIRRKSVEVGVAALLFIGATILLIGWIANGPNNRDDPNARWLVTGALMWFFLEGIIIAGWIRQTVKHRRLKHLQNA